jgi:EAL domain-containing protein (putative c-di-GMP-specific phosphodiesterase class I)
LLRWTHPQRGVVAPLLMVAAAEHSGLINEVGAWVLERSCRDYEEWRREHPDAHLDVAVNVSALQLMHPNFCVTVAQVLTTTGIDPAALVLEITENHFVDDSERTIEVLADIKSLGIRLALDDFGTGYSSLSYLRRLPIDVVKIDQSFVAEIGPSTESVAIVSAVTVLAHALGLAVIAEGVETRRQSEAVHSIGCDYSQGFYYGRPVPSSAIDGQLRTLADPGRRVG